jgi:3-mercaptopyruvate sulfurtransferase SseA
MNVMTEELIISAEALKEYMHQGQTLFFLELRHPDDFYHEEHEWSLHKVRGGLLLQSDTVERNLAEIPPDQTIIIISDGPGDGISIEASRQLQKHGWKNIHVLEGGFKAYLEEGLPVEPIKDILQATKVMNL